MFKYVSIAVNRLDTSQFRLLILAFDNMSTVMYV